MKSKKRYLLIVILTLIMNIPKTVFAAIKTTLPTKKFATCSEYCSEIAPAVRMVKYGLVPVFQIMIPIALIVMGMIDLAKATMAGKEEEMKKSQALFIKRCIYAVGVFFVITIVTLVMGLFSTTGANKDVEGTEDWWKCYNSVDECNDNEEELEESDKPEEEIIIIDN